jgi:hypothetical protein
MAFDRDRVPFCVAIASCKYEKAGYKANGSLLIAFFSIGFRVSRALIQQQPKNQPDPRRTELRHGAFFVDAGVVLGVVLGVARSSCS